MFPQFVLYVEDLPTFESTPTDRDYVYGTDGPFKAIYSVVNIYDDVEGHKIGETKYDIKEITIPGGISFTYTGVSEFTTKCCTRYFVYFAGTRSYEITSTGPKLVFKNVVVQNVVRNGKDYNSGELISELIPEKNQLLVKLIF